MTGLLPRLILCACLFGQAAAWAQAVVPVPGGDASRVRPAAAASQPVDGRLSDASGRAAVQSPISASPLAVLGKDYRISPNDLIDVEVLDLENLKRTVRVNAAGAVSLPLIGQIILAGLTSQEAEARIAERYSEKYLQNPQVTIFIKEFTTDRITVEGAVAKPGIFPLTGQLTLLRAIAMAGGFAAIANSNEVMLFRVGDKGQRQVAVFDVELIRAGKADDPVIRGDDLIVVQRDNARRLLKDSLFRDIIDSINPFSVLAPGK